MKKFLTIFSLLAAICSCTPKEEAENLNTKKVSLSVGFETQNYKWSQGDHLNVWDSKGISHKFTYAKGSTLEGEVTEGSSYAYMIFEGKGRISSEATVSDSKFLATADESTALSNMAVWKSGDKVLRSALGWMRFTLPSNPDGSCAVKALTVKTLSNGESLLGDVEIDYSGSNPVTTISGRQDAKKITSITFDRMSGESVIFAVIPGNYHGLVLEVTPSMESAKTFTVKMENVVIVNRNAITDVGSVPSEQEDDPLFSSDFFDKIVDPESGVVSYILHNEAVGKYHSQSNYFNTKSMTNDGRWLFFFVSDNEYDTSIANPVKQQGRLMDLVERKVYEIPNCAFSCCPYLDPVNDILYYGHTVLDGGKKTSAVFFKRELLVDPAVETKICDFPKSIVPTSGSPIKRVCSHVSLTSDKTKVFIDSRINNEFIFGYLNLNTGEWEQWGHTGMNQIGDPNPVQDIEITHAQVCPTNDNVVLCAGTEYYEAYPNSNVLHPMEMDADGVFPRLQLLEKNTSDGTVTRRTILPDMRTDPNTGKPYNYATHETWTADGRWIYWCTRGVHMRNPFTGEYKVVYDYFKTYNNGITHDKPTHSYFSTNCEYLVFDDNSPDFYRGCRWKVSFYNTLTDKVVRIHSAIPAISPSKAEESTLHPDPHPQFVCNDKYIVSTRSTVNASGKKMHVCITPVDQLIKKTK